MQFFLNKGTIIKCTGYAKINLINNNFLFVCNIGIYRLIVDGHTDFFFSILKRYFNIYIFQCHLSVITLQKDFVTNCQMHFINNYFDI